MYGEELSRQLALDYCCSAADVADSKNHFSIYAPQEGRRRFQEALIRGLKIAVVNGKLLFTGSEEIVAECRKRYANVTGEWFFDAKRLREIEELLLPFHLRVAQAHPFFLPEADVMPSSGIPLPDASDALAFDLIRYDQNAILQFREDNRFDEAFASIPMPRMFWVLPQQKTDRFLAWPVPVPTVLCSGRLVSMLIPMLSECMWVLLW